MTRPDIDKIAAENHQQYSEWERSVVPALIAYIRELEQEIQGWRANHGPPQSWFEEDHTRLRGPRKD